MKKYVPWTGNTLHLEYAFPFSTELAVISLSGSKKPKMTIFLQRLEICSTYLIRGMGQRYILYLYRHRMVC